MRSHKSGFPWSALRPKVARSVQLYKFLVVFSISYSTCPKQDPALSEKQGIILHDNEDLNKREHVN